MCEYGQLRQKRIARNIARLAELGFDNDREMKKASAVKKKSDLSLTEPSHSSEQKDF
jgi:hypothetical protein